MSREDGNTATLKVLVHPVPTGYGVSLIISTWRGGRRHDRLVRGDYVDLGEQLPLDEPGAILLALSDHLAQAADTYASRV